VAAEQTEWNQSRQWKRINEMRIVNWNVHTLYRVGAMNELVKEMGKYKIDIYALQDIVARERNCDKKKNYMILYSVHDEREFGTGFYISRHMHNLLDFAPVSERICKIKVKLTYYNLTLISTHAPTEEKLEVVKEEFYSSLEKVCVAVPNDDMKTLLGNFSAKVGKESYLYPACGGYSLHNKTNDNGK